MLFSYLEKLSPLYLLSYFQNATLIATAVEKVWTSNETS